MCYRRRPRPGRSLREASSGQLLSCRANPDRVRTSCALEQLFNRTADLHLEFGPNGFRRFRYSDGLGFSAGVHNPLQLLLAAPIPNVSGFALGWLVRWTYVLSSLHDYEAVGHEGQVGVASVGGRVAASGVVVRERGGLVHEHTLCEVDR